MAENTNTNINSSRAVLLVDAKPEQVKQLQKDMPRWLWIEAPKGWPFATEAVPTAQSFQAIIVFAQRKEGRQALNICKHIRQEKEMDCHPLLAAVDRYQMALAAEIKRLRRSHFIFTPIKEKALLDKISQVASTNQKKL